MKKAIKDLCEASPTPGDRCEICEFGISGSGKCLIKMFINDKRDRMEI